MATSTASGKSLCYNIPVLQALAADPGACALFMFPTKALAQVRGLAQCRWHWQCACLLLLKLRRGE